jgi:hypothetical protein
VATMLWLMMMGANEKRLVAGNIMNKDTPSSVSRPQALLRFMEVGATQAAESERSRRKVAVSGRVQRHERCRRRTCVDRCEPRGRQRGGVHGGASSVPNGRLPIHVEPLEEDEQILSSEYPLPPDLVGRELAEWEVAEPGVLAAADAVSTRTTPQLGGRQVTCHRLESVTAQQRFLEGLEAMQALSRGDVLLSQLVPGYRHTLAIRQQQVRAVVAAIHVLGARLTKAA